MRSTLTNEFVDRVRALEPVQGDASKVKVVLDIHEAKILSHRLLAELGFRTGQSLSESQLSKLGLASDVDRAVDLAARSLRSKARTSQEVRRLLIKRGIPQAAVEASLERLRELTLIDDVAYARAFQEQKSETWSQREIQFRLRERGVPKVVLDDLRAGNEFADTEMTAARKAAVKYLNHHTKEEPRVRRLKLLNHLSRKGFPPGVIRSTLRHLEQDGVLASSDGWDASDLDD